MTRAARLEYVLSAVLVAVIGALLALQWLGPWDEAGELAPQPWPVSRPAPGSVALDVTTLSLARNSFRAWEPRDLLEVNAFEQGARQHADIVMWFADWERGRFDARQARAVAERGSVPEISWEPWDAGVGPRRAQPRYTLRSIIAGRHDAGVRRFAVAAARYGGPVRLRFAQEMNGRWYPWSESANGNRPGEFARAWRHVHALFAAAGATNVTWIWAPVAGGIRRSQYPGSAYVDVVGLSGFNGGGLLFRQEWRPFPVAFGPPLDALRWLAPDKPVELAELASTEHGGDKAAWIREVFAEVRRRPYIGALVWFNLRKEADWRIESSPAARAAFAEGIATARRGVR
ncbi:MAG TPA: glycosyl hydrolase [Solirubrobacteraceae bacterium]|nr:glycosyl hydrolase [Solirubrobacteraceae bacterium]